jgi:hypothetical protein
MNGMNDTMHDANWMRDETTGAVSLQIELGDGYAVTLTCWKNGDPSSVALWRTTGEHSFVKTAFEPGDTPDSFRQWLREIMPDDAP